jgi:hypothetical protein
MVRRYGLFDDFAELPEAGGSQVQCVVRCR